MTIRICFMVFIMQVFLSNELIFSRLISFASSPITISRMFFFVCVCVCVLSLLLHRQVSGDMISWSQTIAGKPVCYGLQHDGVSSCRNRGFQGIRFCRCLFPLQRHRLSDRSNRFSQLGFLCGDFTYYSLWMAFEPHSTLR